MGFESRSGPVETIILANHRDYFSPLDDLLPSTKVEQLRGIDFSEADQILFWAAGPTLIITPQPMNTRFVSDVASILGLSHITALHPLVCTSSLCDDIVRDAQCYERLAEVIRGSTRPRLISWGATRAMHRLVRRLETDGLEVDSIETPVHGAEWTIDFVGSKCGFRQMMGEAKPQSPHIRFAEGYICADRAEAIGVIGLFRQRGKPCIFKPNRGAGGWGICVFSEQDTDAIVAHKLVQLEEDYGRLVTTGPFVVEEFIGRPEDAHLSWTPTLNAAVLPDGRVELQFAGMMRIADHAQYSGVEIGPGTVQREWLDTLDEIATHCGSLAARLGYRGWFDVDLVVGTDGNLYCAEMNARRTSPTNAFEIWRKLSRLYNRDDLYLVSNDHASLPDSWQGGYSELRQSLIDMCLPIGGEPRGMILSMARPVDQHFGYASYVVVGNDRDDAYALEAELLKRLPALGRDLTS